MKPIKRTTITTAFSILPRHTEMIKHLIEDKGTFTSGSDVVRKALEFFHDKTYPAYIFSLTPGQEIKKAQLETVKNLDSLSPEDFATQECQALVRGGMVILWNIIASGSYFVVPLPEIKEWAKENSAWVSEHKQKCKSEPMDETFVAKHLGETVRFQNNSAVI